VAEAIVPKAMAQLHDFAAACCKILYGIVSLLVSGEFS
jgi:hypothetical protein